MNATFRLTAPIPPEDTLHYRVWCALRLLLPASAVVTTWELRNARDAIEGARRKRLGAQAGWPDLGIFHAGRVVLLELKRERGVLSPAQKLLHPRLAAAGFPVSVCHSPEDALRAVEAAGVPVRKWRVTA